MALPVYDLSHLDDVFDEDVAWDLPPQREQQEAVVLPFRYIARDYQQPLWEKHFPRDALEEGIRRGLYIWHRRAGKDKTIFNLTVMKALERVGTYLYFLPTQTQARKVIWNERGKDGLKLFDHIPQSLLAKPPNATEMRAELITGSAIQVGGSDNYDAWMGTNPVGIVLSEWSLCDPTAWEYFRPILVENDGWAIFIYTPRGKNHGWHLYKTMQRAMKRNPRRVFVQLLTIDDTGAISKQAVQDEQDEGMSEEMVQQEFYCSFDEFNEGVYLGRQLKAAYKDERIGWHPLEKGVEVHTFWDIGMRDSTAVWLVQQIGAEVRCVGYYQNSGEEFAHYAKWVKDWARENEVPLGEHYGPHDLEVREWFGSGDLADTKGKTRLERAAKMGFKFRLVKRVSVPDKIEAARGFMPRCTFHEKGCELGLDGLGSFTKEWDDKLKDWKEQPVHNWAEHPFSAFATLALAWKGKKLRKTPSVIQQPPSRYNPLG